MLEKEHNVDSCTVYFREYSSKENDFDSEIDENEGLFLKYYFKLKIKMMMN